MSTDFMLEKQFAEALGRSHCVFCGRGTTALWLALRAMMRRDGPGEVIIPDILCTTALEGVLLAGFSPVFADVVPGRFTLSARSVAQLITPRTRAILVVHLYGHVADIEMIRQAAPGVPIIEDAVQGFGGSFEDRPAGSLGYLSFISFASNKMIRGRGGALLFDDDTLVDGIQADLDRLPDLPELCFSTLDSLLPPPAVAAYAFQLRTFAAPALLRDFDWSPVNRDQILASWKTLEARVEVRNTQARWLGNHLSGLPVALPELREGDAIWCYTITAPSVILAQRMIRDLHLAGLSGSGLYYPLSRLFGQQAGAGGLANRLVNLWVDEVTGNDVLRHTVDVIAAVPWPRTSPG
jgi:hypothetical protein